MTAKNLGGRPRVKRDAKRVNFRLDADTIEMLKSLAENDGRFQSNKTEVLEVLIRAEYKKQQKALEKAKKLH